MANNALRDVAFVLVPWLLFSMVLSIYVYTYSAMPALVVAIMVLAVLLTIGLSVVCILRTPSGAGRAAIVALGSLCLVAITFAGAVGMVVDEEYMQEYWLLESGASYTNLDPSSDASTHQDAALIGFAAGTFVDTWRTFGDMRGGEVYCVAPITGPTYSRTVQYWAAGVGCCGPRRDFACGPIRDPEVRSGAVIADAAEFAGAARQAVAAYDLNQVENPMFIRITSTPLDRQAGLIAGATRMMMVFMCTYLVISVFVVLLGRWFLQKLERARGGADAEKLIG